METLKAGASGYYDSFGGPVAVKVLKIEGRSGTPSTEQSVTVEVTATKARGYRKGEIIADLPGFRVFPKKALARRSGVYRIRPYKVEASDVPTRKNPKGRGSRKIDASDLNAAARGLGMWSKSGAELQALIDEHAGKEPFASQVIVEAARQVLAAKKAMRTNSGRKAKRRTSSSARKRTYVARYDNGRRITFEALGDGAALRYARGLGKSRAGARRAVSVKEQPGARKKKATRRRRRA